MQDLEKYLVAKGVRLDKKIGSGTWTDLTVESGLKLHYSYMFLLRSLERLKRYKKIYLTSTRNGSTCSGKHMVAEQ